MALARPLAPGERPSLAGPGLPKKSTVPLGRNPAGRRTPGMQSNTPRPLFTYIGISPSGVEWRVWRKAAETDAQHAKRVSTTAGRFAAMWVHHQERIAGTA